jgi:hypothetical protein
MAVLVAILHPDGYAINTSAVFQHYSKGNTLLISSRQTNTNNRTYSSLFSNMVGKEQLGVECGLPRHCRRGGSAEARTGKHELVRARRSPGWRSKAAIPLGPRPSSLPPEPMPSIRLISKLRSPDDACTSTFQDNPFAVIASTAGCRIFLSAVIA